MNGGDAAGHTGTLKRVLVWFFVAVFVVAAVVFGWFGRGSSGPSIPGVTTLQIDGWNIAAASLQAVAPEFHEAHPDVRAHVNMSGALLQARFMLALSAGVGAPDVSQLQAQEVMRYAVTGRLADLTPLARKYWDAFPESSWKDCTYDGKVYGIPWDLGPCAVFYKRDIFERYGIDPAAIETWDDYIAAGQRIVEGSGGHTRMLVHPTSSQDVMFEILLRQGGGQIFDDEGRIAINSPVTLRALLVMKQFVDSGISANSAYWNQPYYASFNKDTIATYPMAVWFGGIIRDFAPATSGNWGVFPLPALEKGGPRTSSYGGSMLVIPEQGEKKDAAMKFVEFALCREDMQMLQYREFDLFPALTTVYEDAFFDEPMEFFGGQRIRRLFTEGIDEIPEINRTRDWMETVLFIRQALGKWAAAGMQDPKGALADLEAGLARRLDREISPNSLSRKR